MKSAPNQSSLASEDENTLYYQLADKIRRLIQSGAFEPGEKLPSIRRLSEEHRVSLNTAKSALALLEDWRAIEVRPQSGHYVRRPPEELPKLSSTSPNGEACVIQTNIPTRMNAAIGSGAEPTLGAAVQSTQLMPLGVLNKSYQKVMRDLPDACFGYDGVPGHETLRKSIAKRGTEAGYIEGGRLSFDQMRSASGKYRRDRIAGLLRPVRSAAVVGTQSGGSGVRPGNRHSARSFGSCAGEVRHRRVRDGVELLESHRQFDAGRE